MKTKTILIMWLVIELGVGWLLRGRWLTENAAEGWGGG